MSSRRIDLHAHSTYSDGARTPAELLQDAAAADLDVLALTDHDTLAGLEEVRTAVKGTSLVVAPGIEFSAQLIDAHPTAIPRSVHLLGYFVDPQHDGLQRETDKIRSHRADRLRLMVERLQKDFDITWSEVDAHIAPGATAGRPHIAQVLIQKGYVSDTTEAFAGPLRSGGPYHVPHYAPRLHTALAIIRDAGGVPVLAHPYTDERNQVVDHSLPYDDVLARYRVFVEQGLAGIEVHHREHSEGARELLLALAADLELIVTGSSDYHGDKKPNRLGENLTAEDQYERIRSLGTGSTEISG